MNKSRRMLPASIPLLGLLMFSPLLIAGGSQGDPDGLPKHLAKMDTNADGKLSADELRAAEDERITELDANADGEVTAEEFRAAREARREARRQAMGQKMMERLDSNGDGIVSTAELKENGHERLMKLDADGDGAISAEELRQHRMDKRDHRGKRQHGRHHRDAAPAADKSE